MKPSSQRKTSRAPHLKRVDMYGVSCAPPFANRKHCWHSRAVKNIKISCLPRDSFFNRSWPRWNYFHRPIKKYQNCKQKHLLKQATWKFSRRTSPFIHHKNTEITYFSFNKSYSPSFSAFIFIFFILLIDWFRIFFEFRIFWGKTVLHIYS